MFGKILGRTKGEDADSSGQSEIAKKISQMNLTEMRAYLKNNMKGFDSCEDGLEEVMLKLNKRDSKTSKRFIELDDMDVKIRKAFELVLVIAAHKKITISVLEQIQLFIDLYEDIITKFDTDNKQIYASRFKDAQEKSLKNINGMSELNNKMKILGKN